MFRVSVILLLLLCAWTSKRSSAQPIAALVISETGDVPVPRSVLTEIAALRLDGADVLTGTAAVEMYRDTVSREAMESRPDALDRLADLTRRATLHVARRQMEHAQPLLEEAMHEIERALDTLSQEEAGARRVLDACLLMARWYVETNQEASAMEHTLGCRRLVPDLSPSPRTHPPEVIRMVQAVDARLTRLPSLRIASDPEGCGVLLNSRSLGITPFEIRVPQGAYRVQLVCEAGGGVSRSRVHEIVLGTEPAVLAFDMVLESVLTTRDQIRLRYQTEQSVEEWAHEHAVEIGRQLRMPEVVHMSRHGGGWRIDRIRVGDASVRASIWLPLTPSVNVSTLASTALRELRSTDLTTTPPREAQPWSPPVEPSREPRAYVSAPSLSGTAANAKSPSEITRARLGGGIALSLAGIGLLAGSLVYHLRTVSSGDDLSQMNRLTPGFGATVDSFDSSRRWALSLGSAAGLVLAGGLPLMLPRYTSVPWWSWGLGVVGAATTLVGALLSARTRGCLDADCTRRATPETGGVLALGVGIPLLMLPFIQLGRRLRRNDSVEVSWGVGASSVWVQGAF